MFFFFKTEWCLLSFQLSSLAQKFPAYCLFCWICAKIWKWIILAFPSLNWDPTIFCPPHLLLFYLFWTILQCKDFCCFHISLWIEISPREVGQVEESSSTILYFSDNIAMEIFPIFSTFLSELRSLVVRLGKGSRQMGATASQSTKLRKIFNLCWNIWERNIWKDKNILAIGVEMHQIVQSWTIGRWRLHSSEI